MSLEGKHRKLQSTHNHEENAIWFLTGDSEVSCIKTLYKQQLYQSHNNILKLAMLYFSQILNADTNDDLIIVALNKFLK